MLRFGETKALKEELFGKKKKQEKFGILMLIIQSSQN